MERFYQENFSLITSLGEKGSVNHATSILPTIIFGVYTYLAGWLCRAHTDVDTRE